MIINLWRVRTERGLSLRDLEEMSGVSKSTLNNIENNRTDPTISQLEKIAKALDLKIQDFVLSDYL